MSAFGFAHPAHTSASANASKPWPDISSDLERALRAAENYKRGWFEKISELETERAKLARVARLLERTCCQFDDSELTCRTELEHKRDWCMHCRVSAALETEA